MKRQAIQNFVSLPGITGLALMDGRARPFFCGLDTTLNSQQKEALAQGIQQVVETTPADFNAFTFQFSGRQANIYKLTEGVILLVLTNGQAPFEEYRIALDQLQTTLEEDLHNAVATFRLLAGCVTFSHPGQGADEASASGPLDEEISPAAASGSVAQKVQREEVLTALNHLSDFTTQYLGKVIVANTWKSARPSHAWLVEAFELDRSGHFKLTEQAALTEQDSLSPEQHQWLKEWVEAFVERCGKIIRDFATILTEKALDAQQQDLLLFPSDASEPSSS